MSSPFPLRIALWSGPRNISTALMYSFAQRPDTKIFDEPLYAHYLHHTDAKKYHPGSEEIIQSQNTDGEKVVQNIFLNNHYSPLIFIKSMTHHLINLDWSFLKNMVNVILTRDPVEMLPSLAVNIKSPTILDTGYLHQIKLLEYLTQNKQYPPILGAKQVLLNPKLVLSKLCARLDIAFNGNMLNWEAKPRKEDGIWAKYWYKNIHNSTGFMEYKRKKEPFPDRLLPLLKECEPLYKKLNELAIKA